MGASRSDAHAVAVVDSRVGDDGDDAERPPPSERHSRRRRSGSGRPQAGKTASRRFRTNGRRARGSGRRQTRSRLRIPVDPIGDSVEAGKEPGEEAGASAAVVPSRLEPRTLLAVQRGRDPAGAPLEDVVDRA